MTIKELFGHAIGVVKFGDLAKFYNWFTKTDHTLKGDVTFEGGVTLPIDYGNTYYISASMGDDATGVKGNLLKPYATFAAVAALYQDNEVIHILDGTANATSVTNLNNKIDIKITINEFATLQNFSYTPSITGFNVYILGNGTISGGHYVNSNTIIGNYTCSVTNILSQSFLNKGGDVLIQANYIEWLPATGFNGCKIGDSISNTNDKTIKVIANKIKSKPVFWPETYAYNGYVSILCNELEITNNEFFGIFDSYVDNFSFNLTCKRLIAPVNATHLLAWFSGGKAVNNATVNINIGYYKGTASIFGDYGPGEHLAGSGNNCTFIFNCDHYECTKVSNSVLKNGTAGELSTQNYYITIKGNYFSNTVPLARLTTAIRAKYKFSGTFKILGAVPAFNLTTIEASARLNLENAKFIVASGQKVVEATGASNVYCMNVVTNSTTTDAEVTEVGQAIVRNANFV